MVALALNGTDSAAYIREMSEKQRWSFVALPDRGGGVGKAYGVQALPTNYVIGPDGKIAARMYGYAEKTIREAVERLAPKK